MTCPACVEAETKPLTGSYYASCLSCEARMLANAPPVFDAIHKGRPERAQEIIRRLWPEDPAVGRRLVWRWVKRMAAAKQN